MKQSPLLILIFFSSLYFFSCSKTNPPAKEKPDAVTMTGAKPLITFIELGSVKCIPCRKMQPVMHAVEARYGKQIRVIFYDVWKSSQRQYAQTYHIRLIPTQVFLNQSGQEIFRHEGFFPQGKLEHFLQKQGLKPGKESTENG